MVADNVVANTGSGGSTFRTFSDGTIEWPASITCYIASGSAGAWVPQQVDSTHGLPVNIVSSVSLAVTGTFWQATQPVSGTLTVNAGTNLNTSALALESGGNLATIAGCVSASKLAVSGTITANIGTTNGLALDTSVNGLLVAQGSATSGEKGPLMQGAVTTSAPSYTTAQTSPLSLTTGGALRVDASAGGTVTVTGSGTFTVSGTVTANVGTTNGLALDTSVNGLLVTQASTTSGQSGPLAQTATTTNAPTYTTAKTNPLSTDTSGLLRVSIKDTPANTNNFNINIAASAATVTVSGTVTANIGTTNGLALDTSVNGILVTQASTTSGQSGPLCQTATTTNAPTYTTAKTNPLSTDTSGLLRVSLKDTPANTNSFLVTATQGGTWTVQPGNTANTTPWLVTQTPATSGGDSVYSVNSSGAANQDAAAIKASAGQLYGYSFFNTTASARYVKIYNLASGATSASTPFMRIYLPPTGGANLWVGDGLAMGTGISIRLTTGAADNDAGACSANDVLANVYYK